LNFNCLIGLKKKKGVGKIRKTERKRKRMDIKLIHKDLTWKVYRVGKAFKKETAFSWIILARRGRQWNGSNV
jgi:hypothetical protein